MKRSLAVLAIPLAALTFVACGDDDDDNESGTTAGTTAETTSDTTSDTASDTTSGDGTLPGGITVPSLPDISIPDVSIPDPEEILGQIFPNLDEDQLSCLADAIGEEIEDFDASQALELLDDCNIDPSDLVGGG